MRVVVAGLMIRDEAVAARVDPFDGPVCDPCRPAQQNHLGIHEVFYAKTAADIRGDQTQMRRVDTECIRHTVSGHVKALR